MSLVCVCVRGGGVVNMQYRSELVVGRELNVVAT